MQHKRPAIQHEIFSSVFQGITSALAFARGKVCVGVASMSGLASLIPVNPMKAIDMRPDMIKVIPIPFKPGTTSAVTSRSRIAAIKAMASHHPNAEPKT